MSKAIVFDLDGTLVDSLPDIVASFKHSFAAMNLPVPSSKEVQSEIGKPLEEMYSRFAPSSKVMALCNEYRRHYPQHFTDSSSPFPGVLSLLKTLRQRGYKTAVATTKRSEMAQKFVRALGLDVFLDHVQGTDDFPHKPAPDVILRALEALDSEGLWMVGDTIADIKAGQAAGLKTYAVTWGTHDAKELETAKPDALRPNLDALLNQL